MTTSNKTDPVAVVLDAAARAGVILFVTQAGKVGWRCKGALPADLTARLAANKAGVLAALAARPNGNAPAFWCRWKTGHVTDLRLDPPHEWVEDPDGVGWCFPGDESWRSLPQNAEVDDDG